MNVRAAAAQVIYQVVDQGQSLSTALPAAQQQIKERDQALLQEICYGVLRWLPRLESITQKLMDKPLKGKQRVFHHLILVGLYHLGKLVLVVSITSLDGHICQHRGLPLGHQALAADADSCAK